MFRHSEEVLTIFEYQRNKLGLTYFEVAKRAGVNPASLSNWVHYGKRISQFELLKCCKEVGLEVELAITVKK
jgi:transcriptional regulator with XRE-family HTH domain